MAASSHNARAAIRVNCFAVADVTAGIAEHEIGIAEFHEQVFLRKLISSVRGHKHLE